MARDVSDETPLSTRDELVAWVEAGCKPKENWRVGVEHEKIPFYEADLSPVPYEGERGILSLLQGLQARTGWEPIQEGSTLIGLSDPKQGGAISLEPGGQFELSGAPLSSAHEALREVETHLAHLKAIAEPKGIGFLFLGMSPKWSLDQTPVMPKGRYRIMRRYMPTRGQRGLDMMFRTATVQANLDFSSEADMVKKLRVSLSLQPIVTAMFANSPFTDGAPNGSMSMRSEIWRDTDPDRTGMMPFAFEDGMGFERYVDYALDVPMYFVKRGDIYHDVAGASFRDFMSQGLAALPGVRASMADWANHLSTLFPEVRLKRFLEMRGQDVGPVPMIAAEAALWLGLLYDAPALDAAWDMAKNWTIEDRQSLRDDVPRLGLETPIQSRTVQDIARETLAIAAQGLQARAMLNDRGEDERIHLDPLDAIVASGETQAQTWLNRFKGSWSRSIDHAFQECRF